MLLGSTACVDGQLAALVSTPGCDRSKGASPPTIECESPCIQCRPHSRGNAPGQLGDGWPWRSSCIADPVHDPVWVHTVALASCNIRGVYVDLFHPRRANVEQGPSTRFQASTKPADTIGILRNPEGSIFVSFNRYILEGHTIHSPGR